MASELAQAYVQILPTTKGIKSGLENAFDGEAQRSGANAGQSFSSALGSTVKKLVVALGIGKIIASAFSEGAALQQSIGGIETLFKDSADRVKEYANISYRTTGLSANAYMENVTAFSASLISSLGGDTAAAAELANTAMTDMSDNANKMGTNMESITQTYQSLARGNYAMLDNLELGYGGTKSEMQRLMKDAEKLTGEHYTVGDFGDTVKAIHAVQDSLGITGTTAKEAATTFSGSFNQMKAAAQDLLGSLAIGGDSTEKFRTLLDAVKTFTIGNALPMAATMIREILTVAGPAGAAVVGLATAFGVLKAAMGISGLIQVVTTALAGETFATEGATAAQVLLNAVMTANPFTLIAMAIAGLVAAFAVLWNTNEGFRNFIIGAWDNIKNVVGGAVNGLISGFNAARDGVGNAMSAMQSSIQAHGGGIKGVIGAAVDGYIGIYRTGFNLINQATGGKLGEMLSTVGQKMQGIKDSIAGKMEAAKNVVGNVINAIKGFFHFEVHLPHINLPHFSIQPAGWQIGDLLKGSIPRLGIEWYAKAMDKGMILNRPTVFGAAGGRLLAGGEAGAEVVVGQGSLYRMIQQAAGGNGGDTFNVAVDGIVINDTEQMDRKILDFVAEMLRKGRMY